MQRLHCTVAILLPCVYFTIRGGIVPGTQTRWDVVTPCVDKSGFANCGEDETTLFTCWIGWVPIWLLIVVIKPPVPTLLAHVTIVEAAVVSTGCGKTGGSLVPLSSRYLNWGWACCCKDCCCWTRVGWDRRACNWEVALEDGKVLDVEMEDVISCDKGMLKEESVLEGTAVASCWGCNGCCRGDGVGIPPTPTVVLEDVGADKVPKCLLGITSSFHFQFKFSNRQTNTILWISTYFVHNVVLIIWTLSEI